mmetsp:Transcript_35694/g.87844  ORF Transcript_35694/g.87844 Transcript_35694/m.87844 type:complete len:207 (+) Transcript_35694:717-1337(+)
MVHHPQLVSHHVTLLVGAVPGVESHVDGGSLLRLQHPVRAVHRERRGGLHAEAERQGRHVAHRQRLALRQQRHAGLVAVLVPDCVLGELEVRHGHRSGGVDHHHLLVVFAAAGCVLTHQRLQRVALGVAESREDEDGAGLGRNAHLLGGDMEHDLGLGLGLRLLTLLGRLAPGRAGLHGFLGRRLLGLLAGGGGALGLLRGEVDPH